MGVKGRDGRSSRGYRNRDSYRSRDRGRYRFVRKNQQTSYDYNSYSDRDQDHVTIVVNIDTVHHHLTAVDHHLHTSTNENVDPVHNKAEQSIEQIRFQWFCRVPDLPHNCYFAVLSLPHTGALLQSRIQNAQNKIDSYQKVLFWYNRFTKMHRRKLPKTSKFKTNKNLTTFLNCLRLYSLLSFVIFRVFTKKTDVLLAM